MSGDIWFSSDQHFGHENIIRFAERPFADVQEMNEMMVLWWNELVGPNDLVYVPGDLCMGKIAQTLPLIARLNGRIILLPGNHDRPWIGQAAGERLRKAREMYLAQGIVEIVDTGGGFGEPVIEIAGQDVKISHFPYVGDSFERQDGDKFSAWRPDDEGGWLIHGHVHGSWKVQDRMINVGVDVWDFRPVHISQIEEIISGT